MSFPAGAVCRTALMHRFVGRSGTFEVRDGESVALQNHSPTTQIRVHWRYRSGGEVARGESDEIIKGLYSDKARLERRGLELERKCKVFGKRRAS